MAKQLIYLSHATYGATPAATYGFFTSDYQPGVQERYQEVDVVKNDVGTFKWIYDNGPGLKKWAPFRIHCEDAFENYLGAATQQFANLMNLWNHPGTLGMSAPDGVSTVHWAGDFERSFRIFPSTTDDAIEYVVVVQFEEAT